MDGLYLYLARLALWDGASPTAGWRYCGEDQRSLQVLDLGGTQPGLFLQAQA